MNLAADFSRYRRFRRALVGGLLAIAAVPAAGWLVSAARAGANDRGGPPSQMPTSDPRQSLPVTAPGRIEPLDGVLAIAAPSTEQGPAIVAALHVREGQWVESGAVLATLNAHEPFEAELLASQQRIAIAHAKLAALLAGAKEEDLRAARADAASAEANAIQARSDARRARKLVAEHLLSTAAIETQESKLAVAERALDASRARLDSLSRARPADIQVAEAEVHAAESDSKAVQARVENTLIRAPSAGRVLAIHAHPGQAVGPEGVLAFGRTADMYVDAEVMEEDLGRVHIGRPATITGTLLDAPATGIVERVGYLIGSRETFVTDPTAFTDSRIVHVKVRVADAARFERFINARVTVEIR